MSDGVRLPLDKEHFLNIYINYPCDFPKHKNIAAINLNLNILVHRDRGARAYQVSVTVHVINSAYSGPKFGCCIDPRSRKCSLFPRIASTVVISEHHVHCVWRVLQGRLVSGNSARHNFLNLLSNQEHCITKAVQLGFILRLSGLDHKSPWHCPRHRSRMKSIIL